MINKVLLIGNLGRDPEVRRLESGVAVAKLAVATNESYKDKNDQWQTATEWHTVIFWRNLAERAERDLKKGSLIYVEGKLTHRKWQDKEGKDRYTTEILASTVQFIGGKSDGAGGGYSQPQKKVANAGGGNGADVKIPDVGEAISFDDDDIPF